MLGLRCLLVGLLAVLPFARAAGPVVGSAEPVKLERLSPALDQLIAPDTPMYTLADGYRWVEGPLWVGGSDGYLLFAEIRSNSIRKVVPGELASVWMQPSGYRGTEEYGGPEPGTNGMTLDRQGRLTLAGHAARNVTRLATLAPGAPVTVLADRFEGKLLNSPNDLVYARDGSLYFTDPPYGLRTQDDKDGRKELGFNGVFRIPHATRQKDGAEPKRAELQALVRDLPRPNGICFSPDGKNLYVDDSQQKRWMRYPVKRNGTLGPGAVFFDATGDKRPGAPDGMKVDVFGNVYSAGPGGVWVFSPAGEHLGTILTPRNASNVAWGGGDGRTLFITATDRVLSVRMRVKGLLP